MKEPQKKLRAAKTESASPDLREIERLLDFMEKKGLEEFEYANGNFRVRLRKSSPQSHLPFRGVPRTPEIIVPDSTPAASTPGGSGPSAADTTGENLHVIKSPIVGTFYASSSPGAEAFVRVGDHVEAGQVLCIIEAMKLMNEIEADVAGEVMRIFVENGQPVEYGEPLFAIHPKRKQ